MKSTKDIHETQDRNRTQGKPHPLLLLLMLVFLLSGCAVQDPHTVALDKVIKGIYVCPEPGFSSAFAKFMHESTSSMLKVGEVGSLTSGSNSYLRYLEDTYASLFTPDQYNRMLAENTLTKGQIEKIGQQWSSQLKELQIKKEKDLNYTYTGKLLVTPDTNMRKPFTIQISGRAEFDGDGKIRWFKQEDHFTIDIGKALGY